MYVCDQANCRVQKLSISKRSFISKFGSSGKEGGQFSDPRGLCIDPEGKVFVSDYSNNCVQVFNEDDSFAYSFPCQHNPWGMARDIFILLLMAHTAAMSSHQRELCSLAMVLELSVLLQALPLMLKATLPSVSMVEAASGSTVLITLMFTHSLDSSTVV